MGSGFEISIKNSGDDFRDVRSLPAKDKYLKNRPGDVLRLYADSSALNRLTRWKPRLHLKMDCLRQSHGLGPGRSQFQRYLLRKSNKLGVGMIPFAKPFLEKKR